MADQYDPRSFAGDPTPPPKAPQRPGAPNPAAVKENSAGGAGKSAPGNEAAVLGEDVAPKTIFRVVNKAGGREVYRLDAVDLSSTSLGRVDIPGADEVLNRVATFDPVNKSWDVPEEAAMELLGGRLPLPAYIKAKYKNGETTVVRGMTGGQFMRGELSPEDAVAKGDTELLDAQLKEAPLFTYQQGGFGPNIAKMYDDLKKAGVGGTARRAAGETAQIAPFMLGATAEAAKGAAVVGGGVAALTLLSGTGIGTPAGIAAFTTALKYGTDWGVFKYTMEIEGGNTAVDLLKKGVEPETVKKLAPVAGALKGALEITGFRFLTAPMKRMVAGQLLGSKAMKALMANWASNYVKEVGGEIGIEEMQSLVDLTVQQLAASFDNNPDLNVTRADALNDLVNTALATAAGVGLLKAPGAVLEGSVSMMNTREEARAEAEMTKTLEERRRALGEEPAAPTEAPAAKQTIPAPEVPAEPSQLDVAIAEYEAGRASAADLAAAVDETLESAGSDAEEAAPAAEEGTPKPAPKTFREKVTSKEQAARVREIKRGLRDTEGQLTAVIALQDKLDPGAAEKVNEETEKTAAKGRLQHIKRRLADVQSTIKELSVARDRLVEEKKSVRAMDKVLRGLMEEEAALAVGDSVTNSTQTVGEGIETTTAKLTKLVNQAVQAGQKEGSPALKAQLNNLAEKLRDRQAVLEEDLGFYENATPESVTFESQEELSMRAQTFEKVVEDAVKEGRKTVLPERRKQVQEIADQHGLSPANLRKLLKEKNIGQMSDVEFENWLEGTVRKDSETGEETYKPGFEDEVALFAERKAEEGKVRTLLRDSQIKREQNIRALHKLPAIAEMTTQQLREYFGILEGYDEGAVPLTASRVKRLQEAGVQGVRTFQEALAWAALKGKVTGAEMQGAVKGQLDPLRGDTELAESQPLYAFMAKEVQAALVEGDAEHQAFEEANLRLGAKALASRARGLADRAVTTMKEVMEYLGAEDVEVQEALADFLTPEELEYALFLRSFFNEARAYLEVVDDMRSRFKDSYAPHTRRRAVEILKGVKGLKDLAPAIGEFYDNVTAVQSEVGMGEVARPNVGLRKFFNRTKFRRGEVIPSANVIRTADSYAKQYFRKKALDKALPIVDTVVEALKVLDKDQTPDGIAAREALDRFVSKYLNNKKGINNTFEDLAPKGGIVDLTVRLLSWWVSAADMAGNIIVQVAAPVGELIATNQLLGEYELARANARLYSAQGRKIATKYEYFTGKGALDLLTQPGRDIDERVGTLLFGLFQWNRARTLKVVLLGSMTEEEFQSGEISAERLAEIKLVAGRWLDVPGMKSVVGSTSLGAGYTKYRGWMLPILRTASQDIVALATPGVKLSTRQRQELFRILRSTAAAVAVSAALAAYDEDDDSFAGKMARKLRSEIFTIIGSFDPVTVAGFLAGGPIPARVIQLGGHISSLLRWETYKQQGHPHRGELKGWVGIKKMIPGNALIRQFDGKKKKERR